MLLKTLQIIFILFLLLCFVTLGLIGYSTYLLTTDKDINSAKTISIAKGQSLQAILQKLRAEQIIRLDEEIVLKVYLKLVAAIASPIVFQAGEFNFSDSGNLLGVLNKLEKGQPLSYSVTFIEGKTLKDTAKRLKNLKKVTDLYILNLPDAKLAELLQINYKKLEGLFLADTYKYHSQQSVAAILKQANTALMKFLDTEWEKRNPSITIKSKYEALILASIVEKETGYAPERATIASVFYNRLRKGMKLQSDPTIIYGLGDKYDGDIKTRDIRKRTAYNTYVIDGLPPTPISLVSRDSILAVLHPASTKYLFFVASGGGKHFFSVTYKEHKQAVEKYLLGK